jgi:molybdate transport system substrate-binding protein
MAILAPAGAVVGALLIKGEAELGALLVNELMAVPGVEVLGPLPPELQNYTVFATGVSSGSKDAAAATALIRFLSSPAARAMFKSKGQEPG